MLNINTTKVATELAIQKKVKAPKKYLLLKIAFPEKVVSQKKCLFRKSVFWIISYSEEVAHPKQ